ncbi:hypothetical protein V2J09_001860 [Rumex salicifolius]
MLLAYISTTGISLLIAAPGGCFGVGGLATLSKFRFNLLRNNPLFRSLTTTKLNLMADKGPSEVPPTKRPASFTNHVNQLQDALSDNPTGGWEKCWEDGLTPWDLGRPTPIVEYLHKRDMLPKGRALVPGCGSGHDVVALACPERYVIGLDVSDVAIRKANELSSSSLNAKYCSFLKEDFFTWHPRELFDLIFDYTFLCAIEPSTRPAWGCRMNGLLKPDGELITLMFPIDDHIGGPPFSTSVADYEKVLSPLGFQAISIAENELAVGPRKGREKLGRWKKTGTLSSL